MRLDASDEMVDHLVDFFDYIAPAYDAWAGGLHGRVASALVAMAAPKKGEHVLDVGTGTGVCAHLAAAKVGKGNVIGIDLSDRMLLTARKKAKKNTLFMSMAAERLVFKPETFDLVIMGEALVYLSDPATALNEANRVLRAGGRLAVSCHRRSLSTPAQDLFFKGLTPLAQIHNLRLPRYSAERARFGEREVLPRLIAESGFAVTNMSEFVTGGRATDAHAWVELMEGAGPLPHTIITALGPRFRRELEAELTEAMESLDDPDDAYRYHHSYLLVIGTKR